MSQLKSITCKAAVLKQIGQSIVIEDVVINAPSGDQVRIKMISAGICASDGHVVWGEMEPSGLPMVLGHEGLALVESVGPEVTSIRAGDLVFTNIMSQCGTCANCKNEKNNFCPTQGLFAMGVFPNKKAIDGSDIYGFTGLGVYSEYVLVRLSQVVKIDPRLHRENACIISCAVHTGFYAATNQAKVTPGSTVVVFGLGAIGLNAIFGAKHAGAVNIIGVDINNDKKAIAHEFGCTEFINPKELGKPVDVYLQEKYSGVGYAIECIGNKAVIETAYKSLTSYGTLALVGVDTQVVLSFPLIELLCGRTVVGGFLGSKPAREGMVELAQMYQDGKYPVDRLVTHKFKLDQINEAFQTLREGKCIRSVIVFDK